MESFEPGGCAVVIGASGGLGAALVEGLREAASFAVVHALARGFTIDASAGVQRGPIDITDETSVAEAAARVGAQSQQVPVRLVIVATGALHGGRLGQPEKTYRALRAEALLESYQINAVGPALVARHMLPLLAPRGRSVFAALSARVGSIGDNHTGGWHAYRAAKAALNMILRNLAIETARRTPDTLCIGLHPGTVDTGLSQPFQRNVAAGKLFTSATAAAHLLRVIDHLEPRDNGNVLAWDGSTIPA